MYFTSFSSVLIISYFVSWVYSLNQLSFSGGGSFGAVEIGICKYIVENNPDIEYDLYTGISAGALNAGFLSYFDDLKLGIKVGETIYSSLRNNMVYELLPNTGISLLNSQPLNETLIEIIQEFPSNSVIDTLIGATNMYSGNLDVYNFKEQSESDKIKLLMASSAIPGV